MPKPTKITEHFTSTEFGCKDGTAYPPAWITSRLRPLCVALEVLRGAIGKPITILSGFRTEAYNRRIGGARASQHVEGRAADIVVPGLTAAKVHAVVLALHAEGKIAIGGLGAYPNFTHVDVRPAAKLARWGGSRTAEQTVGGA